MTFYLNFDFPFQKQRYPLRKKCPYSDFFWSYEQKFLIFIAEAYSESNQIYEMKLFAKIVNDFQALFISAKSFILDVRLGSEYNSALVLKYTLLEKDPNTEFFPV